MSDTTAQTPTPDATAPAQPAHRGKIPPNARRKWLRRTLLLLGPLVVLGVGGYLYISGGRYVSTDNAYVKADSVMVSAEVSGPIAEVAVKENQEVRAGDVLFRIDDRPYRIALAEAQARLAGIEDEIASLKAAYGQSEAELALAKIDVEFAKTEFDRQSDLVDTNDVPRSTYDTAQHDLNVAQQQILVIEQKLAQLRAQLGGDPEITIEQHPRYQEAKAEVDAAALDLERTVVRAPFDGIASNVPQLGQQVIGSSVMSSPVMSVIANSGFWIEANFKETDLTFVQPGQAVSVEVDTYPDHIWHGTVESISQATGAEFSVLPAQNATGNWVKVVQRIPVRIAVAAGDDDPDLRAGMSTIVEIDTGRSRHLADVLSMAFAWAGQAPVAHAGETAAAP